MQSTLRNRNPTLQYHERVLPFCKEIRQFAEESRRHQTLYANLDGQHPERIFPLGQEADIEDYIREAIMHEDCRDSRSDLPGKLARKICQLSSRFRKSEAKFFLIWVYFFNYNSRRMESTVFVKVFGTCEKCYFDCDLEEYSSWDLCVEKCKLPSSFACFPRDGEYVFRGDKLDLEFVCKSAQSERRECKGHWKYQPWSQSVLLPALQNINVTSTNGMFSEFACLILNKLLPGSGGTQILLILDLVIFGIWYFKIGKGLYKNRHDILCRDFKTSVKSITYVLLDKKIPDDSNNGFCLSPMGTSPSDKIVRQNEFLTTFRTLLGNVKENFIKIVKVFLKAIICSWEEILVLAVHFFTPGGSCTEDVKVVLNCLNSILSNVSRELEGGVKTNEEVIEFLDQARNSDVRGMLQRRQESVKPPFAVTLQINCFDYEINLFRSASVSECREHLRSKLKADVRLEKYSFFYQIFKDGVEFGVVAFVTQSLAVAAFKN